MADLVSTLQSQLNLVDAAIVDLLTEKVAESRFGERMYRKLEIQQLFDIRARLQNAIAQATPGNHGGFQYARFVGDFHHREEQI